MITTKIKTDLIGILQIDNLGVRAYDFNYIPIKFNIIFKNDYFQIAQGDLSTYEWTTDYIIEELIVINKSIVHLDMILSDHFTLYQNKSTVYLYHDHVESFEACLKNAILITKLTTRHLTMNMNDSIVKGLCVTYVLYINITNNSACYLDVKNDIITKIKIDNSSLFYIHDELISKSKL